MHYRMEILMPPTQDVEAKLQEVLKDFSENNEESRNAFYDYFIIGGRWSGKHNMDGFGQDKLDRFYAELTENKVTVSSIQFGKQKLSPSSQIPFVQEIWNKYFPGECPVFDHYTGGGDIITWKEAQTKDITCLRFLVTNKDFEPEYMTMDSAWNGVSWIETKWDKTVKGAFQEYTEKMSRYKEEYRIENEPKDDWLLVTVDYHS